MTALPPSKFAEASDARYKYRYRGTIVVSELTAGIPTDPKVAAGWIKKKMNISNEELINEMVAKTMIETGMSAEDDDLELVIARATEKVTKEIKLNVFSRGPGHLPDGDCSCPGLYLNARNLNACIKEALNIWMPRGKWGQTQKGTKNYWVEHVFIVEPELYFGVHEPDGIRQRFPHTWQGNGIQYEEYMDLQTLTFTVKTDCSPTVITPAHWAEIWSIAQEQGLGAAKSLLYGKFVVTEWDQIAG